MRNLKRVLSLALASIMLLGMMVVGASAAGYSDFSDREEIVNKDAVSMLTVLGVIDGKPDGSYAPTENVTREQMAKMISVIMNQGSDNNDLFVGVPNGLTDVAGNWALGHINYCYSLGIIAGRGDGRFDPTANVTASEAAKMLLVAAGYNPSTEGFVGGDWAVNVNAKASALGIFRNYTKSTMAELNRDDAALLIYNALDIEMIQKYEDGYAIAFADHRTILSAMYGVYKIIGVVVGNEWAQLEGTDVDAALSAGRTRLGDLDRYESNTLMTQTGSGIANGYGTFNIATPVEYMGKAVTMFVKKTTILNEGTEVLGVVLKDDLNNVVDVDNNQETNKDATKGTGLTIDNSTVFYANYGYHKTQADALAALGVPKLTVKNNDLHAYQNVNGINMEIIDNDNDGIAEYVLYTKEDLTVVSSKNATKETTIIRGFNKNKAIDDEDIITELDLEVDDVVLAITYGGRYYVSEPEVVTGEMVSYSSSKKDNQYIDVDGTEYRPSYIGVLGETYTSANGEGNIIDFDITLCEKDTGVQFKQRYDFFLDSHGYLRAFRPTDESRPNYALILNSGYDPGVYNSDASGKITVLMADSTEGTYALNFSASASNLANQLGLAATSSLSKKEVGIMELKGFLGTNYTDTSTTRPWQSASQLSNTNRFALKSTNDKDYQSDQAAGYVICYTINDKDVITIKNVIGAIGANKYHFNYQYTDADLAKSTTTVHTIRTDGDTLTTAYSTGNARIVGNSAVNPIAVDLNTVAFYYDNTNPNDIKYGVAVGYKDMANVDNGKNFLASTVVKTNYNATTGKYEYTNTNLADVVLFNQSNVLTARDYAYVYSANTTKNDDTVILNVLFENGEAGTLTMKLDDFEDIFDDSDKFGHAYAYTTNGNGISTLYEDKLGDALVVGNGHRIKVGTVGINSENQYYPYAVADVKIWDVTNAGTGDDGVKVADFYSNKDWYLELVLDADGNVRTAFINEELSTGSSGSWGGGAHSSHTWPTSLVDSVNMHGAYATVAVIGKELADDHDVNVQGDWTLDTNLYIPEGRIVKVNGDMTMASYDVYGEGVLWVTGKLTTGARNIRALTRVNGNMDVTGNASVGALVQVDGNVTGSNTLTVSADGDLHVSKNLGVDQIDIYGHVEAETSSVPTVNVYSDKTLIVYGKMDVTNLTIGDVANTGKVEVGGVLTAKTKIDVVKGSLTTDNTLINALVMNVGENGTVEAGRIILADSSTVEGKVTTSGVIEVTGSAILTVNGGKAVVTAKNVAVDSGATLKTEGGGQVKTTGSNSGTTVKGGSEVAGDFNNDLTVKGSDNTMKSKVTVDGTFTAEYNDAYVLTLNAKAVLNLNGKENVATGVTADAAGAKIVFGPNATLKAGTYTHFFANDTRLGALDAETSVSNMTFVWNTEKNAFVSEKGLPETVVTEGITAAEMSNSGYSTRVNAEKKTVTVTTPANAADTVSGTLTLTTADGSVATLIAGSPSTVSSKGNTFTLKDHALRGSDSSFSVRVNGATWKISFTPADEAG